MFRWIALSLALAAAPPVFGADTPANESTVELDWEQLIPESERTQYSATPPAPVHDYLSGEAGPAVAQSMTYKVNKELDGKTVKIPGFIVPLDLDAENRVIEFFLVPYFGACIHVPPPPPNQIVFVRLVDGIALESMYEAYWITGKMTLESRKTRLGAAAYTLAGQKVEVYKY